MRTAPMMSALLVGLVSAFLPANRAEAGAADLFPMHQGDRWTYRSSLTGQDSVVNVTWDRTVQAGYQVARMSNYWGNGADRTVVLYGESIYEYDWSASRYHFWYAFDPAVNRPWQLSVAAPQTCASGSAATVVQRDATVQVPAGTFRNCTVITYRAPCSDAGPIQEVFAPGVGLIKRVMSNFAGPVEHVLIDATVGGVTFPQATVSGLVVSLALDRFDYVHNRMPGPSPRPAPVTAATLTIRNATSSAIDMVFNSGQSYDVVIRNASGNEVYRWSQGKAFTMAIRQLTLAPGDTWSFRESVDLGVLPDGDYSVEFVLTGSRAMGALSSFRKSTVW